MSSTPEGVNAPPPPPGEPDPSRTQTLRTDLSERIGRGDSYDSGAGTGSGPANAQLGSQAQPVAAGPRRVRLAVSRVDPWSAMKLSFLLSVAIGIMIVIAVALVWFVLDAMAVFASIEELLISIGSEQFLELMDYVAFDRVMSFATIVAVFDVLLLTALGTIMAFLYNITAALVGGLHLTLTDD
ncbi:DUF3566 domain-containing protein [Georgenia halophila]|uniref:DUF3566 domain-containing protein n=1 Tax=Georgenia halophila TaxID=620889 RepID=A0ABP8LBX2_9MICO